MLGPVACGGGSDDEDETTTAPTSGSSTSPAPSQEPVGKAEFIAAGDAACSRWRSALTRAGQPRDAASFDAFLDVSKRETKALRRAFERLTPPDTPGSGAQGSMILSADELLELIEDVRPIFQRDGYKRAKAAFDAPSPANDRAEERTRSYGFKVCGNL